MKMKGMRKIPDYKKKHNELEEEYIYRVCTAKEMIGSWDDVANILNKELGYEYTESKYRKQYQAFNKMMSANRNIFQTSDDAIDEMKRVRDELQKEKMKFYDQRREYNKGLNVEARMEHLSEVLSKSCERMNYEFPLESGDKLLATGEKEAVLILSDIHYGMVAENIWNRYNTEIAKARLRELADRAINYITFNDVQTLHVVILGDCAHGAIHVSARVAAEENTCDQLMHISEILAEMISELANYVEFTYVYSTYGNHMRTIQNKKESIHADNMEKIIPWWIRERLKHRDDICVKDSDYYEFIYLSVAGHSVVATHGDLDSFKNMGVVINSLFSRVYGHQIDYTISGDKHHLEEFEQFGIESTLVRSLCGSDEYANSRRLYSNPGQTLMIFSPEDGKECTYNIKFSS